MGRKIVTISMPPGMAKWVKDIIVEDGKASVSEYIRQLIKQDRHRRRNLEAYRKSLTPPAGRSKYLLKAASVVKSSNNV